MTCGRFDSGRGSRRPGAAPVSTGHQRGSGPPESERTVRVDVRDRAFFGALVLGGSCGAGEAYIDGMFACDDLPKLIELVVDNEAALAGVDSGWSRLIGPASRVKGRFERNTRAGSRRNIAAHYDLSNEFFATFLDETMTYSAGIFLDESWGLKRAQLEKIDRVCRKLELKPSDHVLEIGTGWGSWAMHAAGRYGCRVTTATISREQHALATQRVREAGLEGRVDVVLSDYRDLPRDQAGAFDKLVSIEMIEAVGRERFDEFFGVCSKLLKPDGAMALQAITIRDAYFDAASRRRDFLKRYIFPGSCLSSIGAIASSVARATDMSVVHAEDFGPDYARTLSEWRRTTLGRAARIRALGFDDRFLRLWEFYLAYCEGVFRARKCGVSQLVLTKPMARPSVYREVGGELAAREAAGAAASGCEAEVRSVRHDAGRGLWG